MPLPQGQVQEVGLQVPFHEEGLLPNPRAAPALHHLQKKKGKSEYIGSLVVRNREAYEYAVRRLLQ